MTDEVLQARLADAQQEAAQRPMPGMRAVDGQDWITVDDAFSDQLRTKARLLAEKRDMVLQCPEGTAAPLAELLDQILILLSARNDFDVREHSIRRPDGCCVDLNPDDPLSTISTLIQEDICLLEKRGDEHVLTAALLCFPASWTLSEKLGRPLSTIHGPVAAYDHRLATRVQRLFDGVQIGRPMWRANLLHYADAALYHPRSENEPRPKHQITERFIRSERQTVWRLPVTKAVVFSIHTTVTPIIRQ